MSIRRQWFLCCQIVLAEYFIPDANSMLCVGGSMHAIYMRVALLAKN